MKWGMTTMFVCDAHSDTLYQLAIDNKPSCDCAVNFDRLSSGGVGLQVFALFTGVNGPGGTPYLDGVRMMEAIDKLGIPIIRGALPLDMPSSPHGVISIEGGEVFEGKLSRLHEFDDRARLRMVALTWNHENEIGYPSAIDQEGALKPFGRELIREMDRLGILTDSSHLSDRGFYDACELSSLPVIASHSNARRLCTVNRNLTDDQIRAIIEKNGYIGINFYSNFLVSAGSCTLDDVLRHMDHILGLGGENVLGFGSDFDGIESWPDGLAHPGDYPNLLSRMAAHGYDDVLIAKLAGGNLWRVLKAAEACRVA